MRFISTQTRLNLVVGDPISHSQSPLLHSAVYQALGIDAVLLACRPPSLEALLSAIRTLSVPLTAVTLPYKESMLTRLDAVSPKASSIGSVNTILNQNGFLYGDNTDIDGIQFAFRHVNLNDRRILVIGAGGAARAMGYFLKTSVEGATIFWMNRTMQKAEKLAKTFGGDVLLNIAGNKPFDVICNTTSLGLSQASQLPLSAVDFHAGQIVFDMVYHPYKTDLLVLAREQKATVISGLEMFIGQALKQIESFSNKSCPMHLLDTWRKLLIENQQRGL